MSTSSAGTAEMHDAFKRWLASRPVSERTASEWAEVFAAGWSAAVDYCDPLDSEHVPGAPQ